MMAQYEHALSIALYKFKFLSNWRCTIAFTMLKTSGRLDPGHQIDPAITWVISSLPCNYASSGRSALCDAQLSLWKCICFYNVSNRYATLRVGGN